MRKIMLEFSFSHVPPVMRRGRHALILLQDPAGRFVLGGKSIYPPGIVRMVGGGIDPDEEPAVGAARELLEELGLALQPIQLTPLLEVTAEVDGLENHYTFHTFVYFYRLTGEVLQPADDIQSIQHLSLEEYQQLLDAYRSLPDTLSMRDKGDEWAFRWSDYGALYAEIHAAALLEAQRQGA